MWVTQSHTVTSTPKSCYETLSSFHVQPLAGRAHDLAFVTALQDCYLAFYLTELAGATFMIFTRTCDNTRKMALMLRNLGFDAIPIHGQMAQAKRIGALNKFKAGERSILVATGKGLLHPLSAGISDKRTRHTEQCMFFMQKHVLSLFVAAVSCSHGGSHASKLCMLIILLTNIGLQRCCTVPSLMMQHLYIN